MTATTALDRALAEFHDRAGGLIVDHIRFDGCPDCCDNIDDPTLSTRCVWADTMFSGSVYARVWATQDGLDRQSATTALLGLASRYYDFARTAPDGPARNASINLTDLAALIARNHHSPQPSTPA